MEAKAGAVWGGGRKRGAHHPSRREEDDLAALGQLKPGALSDQTATCTSAGRPVRRAPSSPARSDPGLQRSGQLPESLDKSRAGGQTLAKFAPSFYAKCGGGGLHKRNEARSRRLYRGRGSPTSEFHREWTAEEERKGSPGICASLALSAFLCLLLAEPALHSHTRSIPPLSDAWLEAWEQ